MYRHETIEQAVTCLALVRRDLYVLKSTFITSFIDGLTVLSAHIIIIRYLYTAVGMSKELIGPLYAGTIVMTIMHHGFGLALSTLVDLRIHRRIDYYATLPISKSWLAAQSIIRVFIQMFITSFPLITIGIIMLGDYFPLTKVHLPLFLTLYVITTITLATWFLVASFHYTYTWFLDHMWQRRLDPLIYTGALTFPLWSLKEVSFKATALAYLNPLTYATEGLRYSLTADSKYLSPIICLVAMLCLFLLGVSCLIKSMRIRLDLI